MARAARNRPKLPRPSRSDLDQQAERLGQLRQLLKYMKEWLYDKGLTGAYRVHGYKDGSIDAEISIDVPDRLEPVESLSRLSEALFISGGAPPDVMGSVTLEQRESVPDDVVARGYSYRRGRAAVQTNYTRVPELAPTTAALIERRMKHIQPDHVALRLWWAPGNVRRRRDW